MDVAEGSDAVLDVWRVYVRRRDGRLERVRPRNYGAVDQEQLVRQLYIKFTEKDGHRIKALMAPPGSGKTLIVAALYDTLRRGLGDSTTATIIVPNKAQQRQVVHMLSEEYVVGDGLKAAALVGRDDPTVACPFGEEMARKCATWTARERFLKCPLAAQPLFERQFNKLVELGIISRDVYGEYENIDGTRLIIPKSRCEEGNCTTTPPRGVAVCPYYAQFRELTRADVVVYNFAMHMSMVRIRRERRTTLLYVDEADTWILHYAWRPIVVQLSDLKDVDSALKRLIDDADPSEEEYMDLVNARSEVKRLIAEFNRLTGRGDTADWHVYLAEVKETFEKGIIPTVGEDRMPDSYFSLMKAVEGALRLMEGGDAVVVSDKDHVTVMPRTPSRLVRSVLSTVDYVLLGSGTLPPSSLLGYLVGPHDYIDVGRRIAGTVVPVSTFTTDITGRMIRRSLEKRRLYEAELAVAILDARGRFPDRKRFIHIVAYDHIRRVANTLGVLIVRSRDRELLMKFRNGDEILEIASAMADRGLDFRDVPVQVIPKVPYPDLTSDFWRGLMYVDRKLADALVRWVAKASLVQMIARSLRDKDSVVYVFSPQYQVLEMLRELEKEGYINLGRYEEEVRVVKVEPTDPNHPVIALIAPRGFLLPDGAARWLEEQGLVKIIQDGAQAQQQTTGEQKQEDGEGDVERRLREWLNEGEEGQQ